METREFEIRLANEEQRTIEGVAVPYGQTINVGGIQERFAKGAIEGVDGVLLFWRHEEPIGLVTRGTETDEGYVIQARISETPRGEEAYTLLRDGVISKMSVGFVPVTDAIEEGVVVREKVDLKEVSLVPFPAYSEASILSVREVESNTDFERKEDLSMENTTNPEEIAELRSLVEDMDRRLVVATDAMPANAMPLYRSFGHFVQAVVNGDEKAVELANRTYSGQNLSDSIVKDAWVSDVIRIVDLGRPTVNAFRRSGLPAEGMNVEWPQVKTNTMSASTQAAEGNTLIYGGIELESKTSPVKTFGGYTSLSRQVIERSSVNYLDVAFRAMAIAYSKYVNAQAIAALKALTGTGTASAAATAKGWTEAIADSAISIYENTGLRPEFILASPEVYKKAVTIFDSSDRPIVGGNVNGIGTSNVPSLQANVGGLPMIVDPALSAGDCFIASPEGFVTYESGGAPFRLSNDNITSLTRDFSVYGYAAFAGPMPEAIVKVTVA
jgi:HK97 family phage prohead protease